MTKDSLLIVNTMLAAANNSGLTVLRIKPRSKWQGGGYLAILKNCSYNLVFNESGHIGREEKTCDDLL